jgi:CBS domain-containing protein
MGRVADILKHKKAALHTIGPEASVNDAIETMVRHGIGSLVVMDGGEMVGIFTERDVLRRVALIGLPTHMTPLSQVMSRDVTVVEPELTVEECMERMTQLRVRHLPVVDGGRIVGMISIGDVVQHCLSEREVEVRHLTDYIAGRYS